MREHEVKLAVGDDFELPDLADAIPGVVPEPTEPRLVEDTYYDTEDLRLARWGCTFRHRKRKGWTVKLPVGETGSAIIRDEVNFRGRAGRPPEDAVKLVGPLSRGEPLRPMSTVRKTRVATLFIADGSVVAELVDDRVIGDAADGGEVQFRQLEVELGPDADPAVLDGIVERLVAAGARPAPGAIKAFQALRQQPGPPDVVIPDVDDDPTARAVIHWAIARSVAQLVTELPAAELGHDSEGVHQARVATRRLRSDLRTFRRMIDPVWVDEIRGDLRRLAALLGDVRDGDVLAERLRTTLDRHPEIDGEAGQRVIDRLLESRQAARIILVEELHKPWVLRLLDRLVAGAVDPPTTAAADEPAVDRLPKLVRRNWRRLDRAVTSLGTQPAPSELHSVRILAKRTRYAAAAVAPAFGKRARTFASALAEVQDVLGERNDAAVAEAWLQSAASDLDPRAAFAAGRLAHVLRAEALADSGPWISSYREASRKRHQAWFMPK